MCPLCNAPILLFQMIMIILDLCFNIVAPLFFWSHTAQLLLYVMQDASIVVAVIVLMLSFFSTHLFQAGLILTLLKRFHVILWIWLGYLTVSIVFHVFSLQFRSNVASGQPLNAPLVAAYSVHRLCAVIYYHLYKRTALMITDPKYQSFSYLKELAQQI